MATLNYWLWLTTRRGVGQRGVLRVLEYFGTPERVYFAQQEDLEIIPRPHPTGHPGTSGQEYGGERGHPGPM